MDSSGRRLALPNGSVVAQSGTIQVVIGYPIGTSCYTPVTIDEFIKMKRLVSAGNYDPRHALE